MARRRLGKEPIIGSRRPAGEGSVRQSLDEKTPQINKTVLEFPEPRRIRDRDHIRHVIKQACLDPHRLRFVQSRALGRKVSDPLVVFTFTLFLSACGQGQQGPKGEQGSAAASGSIPVL
jgi:hypothetical protein